MLTLKFCCFLGWFVILGLTKEVFPGVSKRCYLEVFKYFLCNPWFRECVFMSFGV